MFIKQRFLIAALLGVIVSFSTELSIFPADAAVDPATKVKSIYSQGLRLLKQRQFKKAIEKFSKTISEKPTGDNLQALALYHRGLAYQALGQLDKAVADYSRAIKLQTLKDKVLNVVYYNRGLVYDRLQRPEAAMNDFSSAINKNPKFSPAYHNLGNILRRMGKNEPAIKSFLQSLKLGNPQPYLTYFGLALAYENAGQKDAAIKSLKYALDVRPRFKKAAEMLARLTTESLYTFPSNTASLLDGSPAFTSSIPKGAASDNSQVKHPRIMSEFEKLDKRLGDLVSNKPQPLKFKKFALRGSFGDNSVGRVALVVPGPGLAKARNGVSLVPVPRKKPSMTSKRNAAGEFRVQLGTSRTVKSADKLWFFLRAQHGDLLEHLKPTLQRVDLGADGILYRVQAGPFSTRAAADRMCGTIKERAVKCFAVGNSS